MAFEVHKKRKLQYGNPYADFEYYNKNSRKTGRGLFFFVLLGIAMFALAGWRWTDFQAAESNGGTISLTSLEWLLYKITGKWGVVGVLVLLGGLFLFTGVKNYQRLEKIRRS